MRSFLFIAVGIKVDFPDDTIGVCAPLRNRPFDEWAARLQDEACCGRDCRVQPVILPDVTAWMVAAYRECPSRN
jgi:hypothetical protein